jgi:hypothetical protein
LLFLLLLLYLPLSTRADAIAFSSWGIQMPGQFFKTSCKAPIFCPTHKWRFFFIQSPNIISYSWIWHQHYYLFSQHTNSHQVQNNSTLCFVHTYDSMEILQRNFMLLTEIGGGLFFLLPFASRKLLFWSFWFSLVTRLVIQWQGLSTALKINIIIFNITTVLQYCTVLRSIIRPSCSRIIIYTPLCRSVDLYRFAT